MSAPPDAPRPVRSRPKRRRRPAHEVQDQRRRWVNYALIAGSFVVLVNALVGEKGYLANLRARHQHQELSDAVRRVEDENARYAEEIRALQQDPQALEDAARRVLGFVRPGETLAIIHDDRSTPPPAAR